MTRDEAQALIEKRFTEYPQLGAVATSPEFKVHIQEVCNFYDVSAELVPLIENEVRVILSLYAPLSTLPKNITETAGIQSEVSTKLSLLIETLVLAPVIDDLRAYDILWQQELNTAGTTVQTPDPIEARERLNLRPEGVSAGTTPQSQTPPQTSETPQTPDMTPPTIQNLGNMNAPRVTEKGQGGGGDELLAKPLTRDELMSALSAKRTMASDMKAAQERTTTEQGSTPEASTPKTDGPVVGYASYQEEKGG